MGNERRNTVAEAFTAHVNDRLIYRKLPLQVCQFFGNLDDSLLDLLSREEAVTEVFNLAREPPTRYASLSETSNRFFWRYL
jgi:hypothetical protein